MLPQPGLVPRGPTADGREGRVDEAEARFLAKASSLQSEGPRALSALILGRRKPCPCRLLHCGGAGGVLLWWPGGAALDRLSAGSRGPSPVALSAVPLGGCPGSPEAAAHWSGKESSPEMSWPRSGPGHHQGRPVALENQLLSCTPGLTCQETPERLQGRAQGSPGTARHMQAGRLRSTFSGLLTRQCVT